MKIILFEIIKYTLSLLNLWKGMIYLLKIIIYFTTYFCLFVYFIFDSDKLAKQLTTVKYSTHYLSSLRAI